MKILVKQISPEVKSVSGWLVYVMDNDRPIEAKICELDDLVYTIRIFESVFNI